MNILKHADRSALKKEARGALKRHYGIYILLIAFAIVLGVAYTSGTRITNLKQAFTTASFIMNEEDNPDTGRFKAVDVLLLIALGEQEAADIVSATIEEENQSNSFNIGGVEVGYNRGVFAAIANRVSSGAIYTGIFQALANISGSTSLSSFLMVFGAMMFSWAIWYLIKRVYIIVYIRVFEEGRTYKKTPLGRIFFLINVRKWFHVAFALLWTTLWQTLWDLTIVGGIIKSYSYRMVPYILAENPEIGARDALNLSKKMMAGHKWESFVLDMSLWYWYLLDYFTFGVFGIFFLYAYNEAINVSYYARIRGLFKAENEEAAALLDDTYLFEIPSQELLDSNYEEIAGLIREGLPPLPKRKGVWGFISENFGLVLRYDELEEEYRRIQAIHNKAKHYESAIKGETYPIRLSPRMRLSQSRKASREDRVHYIRHYSLTNLVMIFFTCGVVGWIWEVTLHIITDHRFVNRGALHGPWLPIYGWGAIVTLILLTRIRKSLPLTFIVGTILCGVIEYFTSYFMEIGHGGVKWWDYTGYFLNINGRVCAEGLLIFGMGIMAGIYFLCPLLDNLYRRVSSRILVPICCFLLAVFIFDEFYSGAHPNQGAGITDYEAKQETLDERAMIGDKYSIFKGWYIDLIKDR